MHSSQFDQLISAAVAGQGVALGRDPLLETLLRECKLVAPCKNTAPSTRCYCLVRFDATPRKPEFDQFATSLLGQASSA